jgi:hypothetical protein
MMWRIAIETPGSSASAILDVARGSFDRREVIEFPMCIEIALLHTIADALRFLTPDTFLFFSMEMRQNEI